MYKLGDHVKVVKYNPNHGGFDIGHTGVITNVYSEGSLPYEINDCIWQSEDELELIQSGLQINIKYFTPECHIEKIEKGDWIDLRSAVDIQYKTGEFNLIPLGLAMELPEGYEAHIAPRGSTFKKFGVIQTNSVGVVDESFCGDNDQWFMPCYALRDGEMHKGDRICQFRIIKKMKEVTLNTVEILGNVDRGSCGSTGVK